MRWSYTMLSTYELCPLQYKFKYLERLPQGPKSPAMARGIKIHKEAEDFLAGRRRAVPASLASLRDEFKLMKKLEASPEAQYYFDDSWKPCDRKVAWGVAKLDAIFLAQVQVRKTSVLRMVVVDVKTGQVREYDDQGRLYVCVGMSADLAGEADEGTYQFYYVDQGLVRPEKPRILPRRGLPALQKEFERRVAKMQKDKTLRATPGADPCKWCDWKRSKGGPCKHG